MLLSSRRDFLQIAAATAVLGPKIGDFLAPEGQKPSFSAEKLPEIRLQQPLFSRGAPGEFALHRGAEWTPLGPAICCEILDFWPRATFLPMLRDVGPPTTYRGARFFEPHVQSALGQPPHFNPGLMAGPEFHVMLPQGEALLFAFSAMLRQKLTQLMGLREVALSSKLWESSRGYRFYVPEIISWRV